ncbi:hypothetical protein P153DRAFT_42800 [Dothidotthia symphoricarpi CBS 119687]|uniref:Uncharacterized protein n=1 Tax=Dothidotthia symphoricarpi CBS 119687 TaxID=1392245 RepID=A0A6A6AC31_9PLEO|nr:uncharacterized protein P153DRAFT_42800 [Dothidotthia symphoricarpi CBS 119687]KAF2128695.1 hypothetical protein P153DRAFT_42800 [Dothidotthia symphoricarpi CBS 119687]
MLYVCLSSAETTWYSSSGSSTLDYIRVCRAKSSRHRLCFPWPQLIIGEVSACMQNTRPPRLTWRPIHSPDLVVARPPQIFHVTSLAAISAAAYLCSSCITSAGCRMRNTKRARWQLSQAPFNCLLGLQNDPIGISKQWNWHKFIARVYLWPFIPSHKNVSLKNRTFGAPSQIPPPYVAFLPKSKHD